jgi:hypothetical protein
MKVGGFVILLVLSAAGLLSIKPLLLRLGRLQGVYALMAASVIVGGISVVIEVNLHLFQLAPGWAAFGAGRLYRLILTPLLTVWSVVPLLNQRRSPSFRTVSFLLIVLLLTALDYGLEAMGYYRLPGWSPLLSFARHSGTVLLTALLVIGLNAVLRKEART